MLAGHFAVALIVKRMKPRISLGTAVIAAMMPDLLWPIFSIAGIERFAVLPDVQRNRLIGVQIGYSHSLLMDIIWAGAFSGVYFAIRKNARAAWILAAAVLSHWVLDVISHRPDMPLAPGVARLGLGLWNSPPAALVVEGGFWLFAIVLYVRATKATDPAGIYGFWIFIALLTWIWIANLTAPPPPSGAGSLVFFTLVVAWACWLSQKRLVQPAVH